MAQVLYTFGQVEDIAPFNQFTTIARLSNYAIFQDNLNNSLTSDLEKSFQYVQVVGEGMSVSGMMQKYENLMNDPNRYKELMTIPVVTVTIPTENVLPTTISCLPLFADIIKAPQKGQWVYIMGIPKSMLGMNRDDGYMFYYIPYSYFFKTSNNFYSITPDNAETGQNARNILWPREGSTIFSNENGTSYIQLDNNDILMSSGYVDLAANNKNVIDTKYEQFRRINPVNQLDAFIYISKYNRLWEELLFNYLKELYETNQNERINTYIEKLLGAKSFEERLRVIFNINLSRKPAYDYAQSPEETNDENDKDSGIAIVAKNIYLTSQTPEARYHAGRGDRILDLLTGIVMHLENVNRMIQSHQHLGTPASVLTPDPSTISTIAQLNTSLAQIKGKLESILSPNIFIS